MHKSPLALKRVGLSRTYIRPLQRDLDLTPLSEDEDDAVCGILPIKMHILKFFIPLAF